MKQPVQVGEMRSVLVRQTLDSLRWLSLPEASVVSDEAGRFIISRRDERVVIGGA